MSKPHVVILGAGPAGAGAAYQLTRQGKARVTVLERNEVVGGNAGSFKAAGQRLDYGSHRLHPACEPHILDDIRALLGDDLLDRPRHGRINLRGRWIHFPLKPVDLLLRLDPGFAAGVARDAAGKLLRSNGTGDIAKESFASVLEANLGPTICHEFYFPYAEKIWGVEPDQLSATQARRRVSAGSFAKLIKKVASAVPGLKPPGSGRFYYPRKGFGQITEAFAEAAVAAGADFRLATPVRQLIPPAGSEPWKVVCGSEGSETELAADYVWSTIPISALARLMSSRVPERVEQAAGSISYRAMLLIYLHLETQQFTPFDAHYFPGRTTAITRLSEPKNYADDDEPTGRTTLCAELPCTVGDGTWSRNDEELGRLVAQDLSQVGIPLASPPASVTVRRLPQAYPIYLDGYQQHFGALDDWASALPRFLTYGRQGLFAHDNTHHALAMAYAAAECLGPDGFDERLWREHRRTFESHVVED